MPDQASEQFTDEQLAEWRRVTEVARDSVNDLSDVVKGQYLDWSLAAGSPAGVLKLLDQLEAARARIAELESPEPPLKRFGEACRWAAWFAAERDYIRRALDCMGADRNVLTGQLWGTQTLVSERDDQLAATRARITSLESGRAIEQDALHAAIQTISRVTDLFEKWAAEESEHRAAGEYGLAEGLHVAIEELRMVVHGTYEEPYRD
jgi:hypothetical protein